MGYQNERTSISSQTAICGDGENVTEDYHAMDNKEARGMVIRPEIFDSHQFKQLPKSEKLVWLCLAVRADQQGKCNPSLKKLSADTGLQERALLKTLNNLSGANMIERVKSMNWFKHESTTYNVSYPQKIQVDLPVNNAGSFQELPVFDAGKLPVLNAGITDNIEQNNISPISNNQTEELLVASDGIPKINKCTKKRHKKQGIDTTGNLDEYIDRVRNWINNAPESFWDVIQNRYPEVDLQKQTERAINWLKKNPKKRKTDIEAFLNNWYKREIEGWNNGR